MDLPKLIDGLPQGVRDFLNAGGWWFVGSVGGVLVLLMASWMLRGLWRKTFGRRRGAEDPSDRRFFIQLSECPLSAAPPEERHLTVYHVPVRMRLVVVAPVGREADLDATAVEKLLDQVVPGLGDIARWDRPRIRVWPAQLSHHGFASTFHRRMIKPEPEGQPSRWVLVAGRAQVARQAVLIGLGLWADKPNAIGHVNLEPLQWLDVLRLARSAE